MVHSRLVAMGLVAVTTLGGCATSEGGRAGTTAATRPHSAVRAEGKDAAPTTRPAPYIVHLPGIGGPLAIDRAMAAGLVMAALPQVEVFDWTAGDAGLHALTAYDRNREQARLLAEKLTKQYRAEPTRPIIITGHSGGTGIAVWALEQLPADVKVQTVVLMASALSPGYDLSGALSHVTGRAYALYSPHDNIVLGTGTTALGTIDRVYTRAAGMVGFTVPENPKVAGQYRKLVSMPYVSEWMEFGNLGDHIGPMRRLFAAQVLAPLMGGTPPVWVKAGTRPTTRRMAATRTAR